MKPFNDLGITNAQVSRLEDDGYGDEAVALALLAGIELKHERSYYYLYRGDRPIYTGGWNTAQRAAIFFCLGSGIELTSGLTP
jgi:hypothetical protein